MFTNVLILLLLLVTIELLKTSDFFKIISLVYSSILLCVIFSCLYLKLDLFGITVLLVYSSVVIMLILLSFILNNKNKIIFSSKNFFILYFSIFISSFFFYNYQKTTIDLSWVSPYYVFNLKSSQFVNILHILIIKIFQIETLILNYYLLLGLVASVLLILNINKHNNPFKKIMFSSKNRRLIRRSNSFNIKINNKK
jgi:hypothetical protein